METEIISYYRNRAKEYEKIYDKTERQPDLKEATRILQQIFCDKQVFEVACGTGYWTERISITANSILATDINEAVIDIARSKNISPQKVSFEIADIHNLAYDKKSENAFGGFIWSHIKLQELNMFLSTINSLVVPGGTVVFMDNKFVPGSNHEISKTDENGNTFQKRQLENGTTYSILKNFPTETFIRARLEKIATDIQFFNLTYFWIVCYKTV